MNPVSSWVEAAVAGLLVLSGMFVVISAIGFLRLPDFVYMHAPALAYTLGPISGCHVNPAVTMGFVVSRRMSISDAVAYWIAQFAGGIVGAVVLWAVFEGSPFYSTKRPGLGTDGWLTRW